MKALSVHQPWAWAILHAGKNVENRSWATRHQGPLLIHAAKSRKSYDRQEAEEWLKRYGVELPAWEKMVTGSILGMVEIVDCMRKEVALPDRGDVSGLRVSVWAEPDSWCWVLANPRQLNEPVAFRGEQGLFEVLDGTIQNGLWNKV